MLNMKSVLWRDILALTAYNVKRDKVYAWDIEEREKAYMCTDCGEKMSYVNAQQKIKHFRHYIKSNCNPKPETYEHRFYKQLIFNKIKSLNIGKVDIEKHIGKLKADVYCKRDDYYSIIFEIQVTNIDMSDFESKIKYYSLRMKKVIIVYLFVKGNFFNEIKDNIYSLKEIEKRICFEMKYSDSVLGGYILGSQVSVPKFKQKQRKGSYGICENRFIVDYKSTASRNYTLNDFLIEIAEYRPIDPYKPMCDHSQVVHSRAEYEQQGIKRVRYEIRCEVCSKFIGYLKNSKAKVLGYSLS